MKDMIHKILYTGIGLASMTEEKIKDFVKELEKKGDVSSEEGKKLAQDLIDKAKKQSEHIQETIQNEVHKVLNKLPLVPRKDFEALQKRVEDLERCSGSCADDTL